MLTTSYMKLTEKMMEPTIHHQMIQEEMKIIKIQILSHRHQHKVKRAKRDQFLEFIIQIITEIQILLFHLVAKIVN